jgi:hypothetical protein
MDYIAKLEELVSAHLLALQEMNTALKPFTDAEADYAEAEAKAFLRYANERDEKRTVKHLEMLVAQDCMPELRRKISAAARYRTATKYAEGLETTISAVQSLLNRERAQINMDGLPQPGNNSR